MNANKLLEPIKITLQKWDEDAEPLVSISCITYNHEKYIRDAIEGFLMQKTTFPLEILIHDDASTDKTASIVKEYEQKFPHLIKPIYQTENQYSKKDGTIGRIQRNRARGKYYAICEGDDYWIDPLKLQKQVDFLEQHSEYGLCYTKAKVYDQLEQKFTNIELGKFRRDATDLIIRGNEIPTLSTVFRNNLLKDYMQDIGSGVMNKWTLGDYPLWLYISCVSKIYLLEEETCVYRKLQESASHHNGNLEKILSFTKSTTDISLFFSEKFNLKLENRIKARFISFIAFQYTKNEIEKKRLNSLLSNYKCYHFKTILTKILISNTFGLYIYKWIYLRKGKN